MECSEFKLELRAMDKILKQSLGFDVSQEKFDVALFVCGEDLAPREVASETFDNTKNGFKKLSQWYDKLIDKQLPIFACMKATGVYHEHLCRHMYTDPRVKVSVVLPNKSRKFIDSLDWSSKTDKLDAKALSLMGLNRKLRLWVPPKELYRKLRRLTREREHLSIAHSAQINFLHAMETEFGSCEENLMRVKQLKELIHQQIKAIDKQIENIVNSDDELKQEVALLKTIPGVGQQTAVVVLAETNNFQEVERSKQLVSYAGLDIRQKESGKWKGKTKISKKGNRHIRAVLYMPALTIIRGNSRLAQYYKCQIEKGKHKMTAITAISRKLLVLMYGVWKTKTVYQDDFNLHLSQMASGNTRD